MPSPLFLWMFPLPPPLRWSWIWIGQTNMLPDHIFKRLGWPYIPLGKHGHQACNFCTTNYIQTTNCAYPPPWSNLSFKPFIRMLAILLQGGCSRNSHTGFCYHPTIQWCPCLKISPVNILSVRVLHPLIGLPMAEFSLFPFQRN